jgi:hypothetical protein
MLKSHAAACTVSCNCTIIDIKFPPLFTKDPSQFFPLLHNHKIIQFLLVISRRFTFSPGNFY